jgi:cadmium resistance protein CadD (predicted permease)
VIEALVLAFVSFASTNVDDAFVLLAFFADPDLKTSHVVAGQYVGMAALTVAALLASSLVLALPDKYIGFIGLLPILIGMRRLWIGRSRRGPEGAEPIGRPAGGAISAVAFVTIANGGDNIAVYVPLFAKQDLVQIVLTCVVFVLMTGVWCFLGKLLVSHPAMREPMRAWGYRIVPFVLIAIGAYILVRGDVPLLGSGLQGLAAQG